MTKLVLVRGIPASGKSTFARSWVQEAPSRVRVNRDNIRQMCFVVPNYSWDQEKVVTAMETHAVEIALKSGLEVVVDAMNLRSKYVRDWLKLAAKHSAEVEIIDFDISLEEALARNAKREGVERIAEDFIRETHQKYTKKDGTLVAAPKLKVEESESVKPYYGTPGAPKTFVFDIDGTLALMTSGRNPYDFTRVHEDTPNPAVVSALHAAHIAGYNIVYCSGRGEDCRDVTEQWLHDNVGVDGPLFMRKSKDFRKDSVVKRELFDNHIRDQYDVVGIYDDRDQVVAMWRDLGITCMQVEYGEF